MRPLVIALLAAVLACPAGAQIVVPNISDVQIMNSCGELIYAPNHPGLTISPTPSYQERGFAVFAADSFPAVFGDVVLEFNAGGSTGGTFEVVLYGADAQELDWEIDLRKAVAYGGAIELPGGEPSGTVQQLDVTDAVGEVIAVAPAYVIAKFYVRTGESGVHTSVYSNETPGGTGPRLVFYGAVPAEGKSFSGVKGLFR